MGQPFVIPPNWRGSLPNVHVLPCCPEIIAVNDIPALSILGFKVMERLQSFETAKSRKASIAKHYSVLVLDGGGDDGLSTYALM